MIPTDDIQSQILAAVHIYVGISPSEITPQIYGYICAVIMDVPGVASVAIHCDRATGAVDASVELADGEVITVSITEAVADPIDALAKELVDAIDSGHGGLSFVKGGILRSIVDGIAHIVHERDLKIAVLEARVGALTNTADGLVCQGAFNADRLANLESQIASAQVSADIALQVANGSVVSAAEANAMAHAAIHSAADKRIAAADAQAQISRRDPLRQL